LAVACALCKGGHKVRVLEKLPALGTPCGGLRVPPNMSKILKKWAGGEELAKTSVLNLATPWWDLHTGEHFGDAHWKPAVMHETGGEFLLMKHEDVHRLLYRLAVAEGAKVDFGVVVAEVTPGDPRPSVTLSTGEVIEADIIIGADGPLSKIRKIVNEDGEDESELNPSGYTMFGAAIPAAELMKDPEIGQFVQANKWAVFMGNNRSLTMHPIRSKKELAIQMWWPDEDAGPTPDDARESWYDTVPTSSIKFDKCCSIIQRIMKLTPHLYRSRWMKREDQVEEWIDESGRIILIGEAAHPWHPNGTYGPAIVLEDALVLGTLFKHLSSWDQVPTFLNAYQEIRQARTTFVNKLDCSNSAYMRLPPGPERDARNATMSAPRDDWDDGGLKNEFEGLVGLFGYDAEDAAEEWWVTWGRYGKDAETTNFSFQFESQSSHTS